MSLSVPTEIMAGLIPITTEASGPRAIDHSLPRLGRSEPTALIALTGEISLRQTCGANGQPEQPFFYIEPTSYKVLLRDGLWTVT